MEIKGIIEEVFDNEAIVVLEDYDDVTFWFDKKGLPEGAGEGDIIDIYVPDDVVIPTEHSLKEPYESDGQFQIIRIDHEEKERRIETIKRMRRELGHWEL
jgi:hypothetical protein